MSEPGTAMDRAPVWLRLVWASPSRMNMSLWDFSGAVSRPLMVKSSPLAFLATMKQPPPMPELYPFTTPRVNAAATDASKALPPFLNA